MELSLFLAHAWGLFITICCVGIFLNKKNFLKMLTQMEPAEFVLAGLLVLGIGVAQVVGYENWGFNWQGLITLFGWVSLLKGVTLFVVPGYSDKFVKVAVKEHWYTISLIIGVVLGVYLLYVGYIMH